MNTHKTTDNVVEDIYALMVSKDADPSVDVEAEIDRFGEGVKALMRTEFGRKKREDNRRLRLSNIGRTDKYLWNHFNGTGGEEIQPHTYVKFMYGHLIEEMLIFLTRMAGHTVTDEQKVCNARLMVLLLMSSQQAALGSRSLRMAHWPTMTPLVILIRSKPTLTQKGRQSLDGLQWTRPMDT